MTRMQRRTSFGAVLLAAVAACTNPVQLCGCVLPPPAITVLGTVRAAGAPVPGASVAGQVMPGGCEAGTAVSLPGDAGQRPRTGPAGEFRLDLPFVHGASAHCVRVLAVRAGGDSLLSAPAVFTPINGEPVTLTLDVAFP